MAITCKDVMVEDQPTLAPEDAIIKAFQLMRKKGVRFLPIVDSEGQYLGVFTSPTLIKLLLPRAVTLQSGSSKDSNLSLNHLNFYNVDGEAFHNSLSEIQGNPVIDYMSDPENIPMLSPDVSVMEGAMMLHNYKRPVVLIESEVNRYVGVVTINSIMRKTFDENHSF